MTKRSPFHFVGTPRLDRLRRAWPALLVAGTLALVSPGASALVEIEDDELTDMTGEGLTFIWTDFRMMFDPQSYVEAMGSPNGNTCTSAGNTAGNYNCWRRGDLRWYGANASSGDGTAGTGADAAGSIWGTTWTTTGSNATQCASNGIRGLGCPRGGPIQYFAAHDNPYILRVLDYAGDASAATSIGNGITTYQGVNTAADWANGTGGSRQTVLEWFAPTKQDRYRVSFWGELEVGRGTAGSGLLQSQTLLLGNASGSILRFFKFTQTSTSPGLAVPYNPALGAANCGDQANNTATDCGSVDGAGSPFNNRTLGMQYVSHLRSDFRFSVAQVAGSPATPSIGTPAAFHAEEGMYYLNADVYLPIGQPFYQAWIINLPRNPATNAPLQDGNYTLEMPLIPNRTSVYTRFYSLNSGSLGAAVVHPWDYGYATARAAFLHMTNEQPDVAYMPDAVPDANYPKPNANYYDTHGYAHWGDWFPCQGRLCDYPTGTNTVAQADGTPVNVGGVMVTGRNSWRSNGDGVFFKNIAAYNAYSYRIWAADMRGNVGGNFTRFLYMSNYAACSTDIVTCGYGGRYLGASSFGSPVTSVNIEAPENAWFTRNTSGSLGGTVARNVIPVPANGTLNLGDSRIEGIQLNYLRFTTFGANY